MKRMRHLVLGTALLMAACQPRSAENESSTAATKASADEAAAVTQVRDNWAAAWERGDAAALAALYTDDAADMANHHATVIGGAAVQQALGDVFAQMTPKDITLTSEKLEIVGDMAYDRGTFAFTSTPKSGGAPISDSGRYLVVLRRQADGSWKLAEAMGNSATPLPAN